MDKKICKHIYCDNVVEGRSDKVFCSRRCKGLHRKHYRYHNDLEYKYKKLQYNKKRYEESKKEKNDFLD